MILLAVLLVVVFVWASLTFVAHHVRHRHRVWRIRLGLNPKLPKETRHRYFDRKGNWRGPSLAETLERLGRPDGLDWHNTVLTIEKFYKTGQFSREKAIGALHRLERAKGPVAVVSWPDGPELIERPAAPSVLRGVPTTSVALDHLRPDPGRTETR